MDAGEMDSPTVTSTLIKFGLFYTMGTKVQRDLSHDGTTEECQGRGTRYGHLSPWFPISEALFCP